MSITYDKKMRDQAKAQGKGLITIAWESPKGYYCSMQSPADGGMIGKVRNLLDSVWGDAVQDAAREESDGEPKASV